MKILLLGKNGQLGRALYSILKNQKDFVALGKDDYGGNFNKPKELLRRIEDLSPDIIFNAVAYTNVDLAEAQANQAKLVNSTVVGMLANYCARKKALLVHYSTDYVFDGLKSQPYTEDDLPNPLNIYGLTKVLGEKEICHSGCQAFVFRTSWAFSESKDNFLSKILTLASERKELFVVEDQIGVPTSVDFIAEVSANLAFRYINGERTLVGLYNLVPNGFVSRFEFAKYIVQVASDLSMKGLMLKCSDIKPISSNGFSQVATRPLNSRLSNLKLHSVYKESIGNWDSYVYKTIKKLIERL